jgi:hypothetical protein
LGQAYPPSMKSYLLYEIKSLKEWSRSNKEAVESLIINKQIIIIITIIIAAATTTRTTTTS